ncbi:uncharacterized protein LOC62_01G000122 [Vanrija pseudolonga]|uniref:Uncharacterized protein n=1 Tax=Vanrija pseudolonga TaxID=143232 RepID=A0AAF1BHZ1_9TREE|nr:hypothetical protein LOC62_01G000122 [Vanrija pseudolonga]
MSLRTLNLEWPFYIATPYAPCTVDDEEAYYVYVRLPNSRVWRKIVSAVLYEEEKRIPKVVASEHATIQTSIAAAFIALNRLQAGIINPKLNPYLPVSAHAVYDETMTELDTAKEMLCTIAVLEYFVAKVDVSVCSGTANMSVIITSVASATKAEPKVHTVHDRENVLATIAQRNAGLVVLFDFIARLHYRIGEVLLRTQAMKGETVSELSSAVDDAFASLCRALAPLDFQCKIPNERF